MEALKLWDTNLFLFLNGFNSPFFDGFMWAVSEKFTWIPLYMSVVYIVAAKWRMQGVWVLLALVAGVVIADQVASGIIKEVVQRPRPSHVEDLQDLIHLVHGKKGGRFGFVSSHAANSVCFALLSSLLFRNKLYSGALLVWAVLVSYSRIYLGVHYPLDIIGGAIVGIAGAILCFYVLKKFKSVIFATTHENGTLQTAIPVIVLGISFMLIIFHSLFIFQ